MNLKDEGGVGVKLHISRKTWDDYPELSESTAFGFVDGVLYVGGSHHAAIMNALVKEHGYDWEKLVAAPQAWGWIYLEDIGNEEYNEELDQYEYFEDIVAKVYFHTDVGKHDPNVLDEAFKALEDRFNVELERDFNPYSPTEYGKRYFRQYVDEKGWAFNKKPVNLDIYKSSENKKRTRKKKYKKKRTKYYVRPRKSRNKYWVSGLPGTGWDNPELAAQWKKINDAFEPHDIWVGDSDGTAYSVVVDSAE